MAAHKSIQATFAVRVKVDPFVDHSWRTARHPVGLSVADALAAEGIANDEAARVSLEGNELPPDKRDLIKPRVGRVVLVEPTPGGPAFAAATIAASWIGTSAVLSTAAIFSISSALVIGGLLYDSRALLDKVFGIGGRRGGGNRERDILATGRNYEDQYGQVPVVLGKRRFAPPVAMKPHAELDGNNAYFNTLLAWGHAPTEIEDIQIGNEPITAYRVEAQHDLDGKGTIKFAPRQDERRLNVALSSTWYSLQTEARAEYISVDVSGYPYAYTSRSEEARSGTITDYTYYPYHRTVRVQYRRQGTSTWKQGGSARLGDTETYTIYGRQGGSRRGVGRATITIDLGQDPDDRNRRLPLPDAIYEVRVMVGPVVSSAPANARTGGRTITLDRFKSRLLEKPVNVTGVALSALRIFIPDGENPAIDEINAIVGTKVVKFQDAQNRWPPDIVARHSSLYFGTSTNPADLYRALLTSPDINARPLDYSFVDDDNLAEWWRFCNEEGFTYSKIVRGTETIDELRGEIAKAGRALPRMSEGKWGVTINRAVPMATQVFTPRNTDDFAQRIDMPEFPHGLRVAFANEEADWEPDERVVYDDGYGPVAKAGVKKATHFEQLNLPGVTNANAVYKLARYVLAAARLRPRTITLRVGYASLAAELGDRVKLAHDAALIGQAYGRIKSIDGGAEYGAWDLQKYTSAAINFATYNPTKEEVGLFPSGSNDAPLNWKWDGAYAVRQDGNTQYVIAAYGPSGKAVRSRTRASQGASWGAWGAWRTDTGAFEANNADRVVGRSGPPVLFKLGTGTNGPANEQLRRGKQTYGTWAILTDSPANAATTRQHLYHAFYGERVWTRRVTGGNASVEITLDEPVTFEAGKNYALTVALANGETDTLAVTGDGTTYAVQGPPSGAAAGDAFAFGEQEQDFIISAIEPVGGGNAQITLLPYAPDVFNAAEAIPVYKTNISRPVGPTFAGPPTPVIDSITSDEEALPLDVRGVPTPTMLVKFRPGIAPALNAKVTAATQLRIEYRRVDDTAGEYQSTFVPINAKQAYLAPVVAREEYDIRIRAEDTARGFSRWAEARHSVIGLAAPPSAVTTFSMEVAGNTTALSWTHRDAPRDLVGYVIRFSPNVGERRWDKMLDLATNVSPDDRGKSVPTINGTLAIKARDVLGNFSETALYRDSVIASPPEEVKVMRTITESPAYAGTKEQVEVRNGTLQLQRRTLSADDPELATRSGSVEEWTYLTQDEGEFVYRNGTYTTAVTDMGGVFTMLASVEMSVNDPANISNLMSRVEAMDDLKTMSGVPSEDTTDISVECRSATTRTGSGNSATYNWTEWDKLVSNKISGRYFQFRVLLGTDDINITPIVGALTFKLSAKARSLSGKATSATGAAKDVPFSTAFEEDDIVVNVTILNGATGDYVVIDSEAAGKFSFSVRNSAGNRIERQVAWTAVGHGEAA